MHQPKAMEIPFNKPYFTGREAIHVANAGATGKLSGNGRYTQLCHDFFSQKYNFGKVLLTSSCTDALEMAALLAGIEPGDEVIIPSFTFVSTANAFALRGAVIRFADSELNNPNVDVKSVESLITSRTRAIVVVHYGGIACDMDALVNLATKHNIILIEDAAHAIDSVYKGKPLGSFGHLATFSFHETKNISCGEGGMLVVNDSSMYARSEIVWEKGTNRAAFYRGEVDKYGWVDLGSSYLPSDLAAAYLLGQLDQLDEIQRKRRQIFAQYQYLLQPLEDKQIAKLPTIPDFASQNGHLFYISTQNPEQRDKLIAFLKEKGIQAVFHYLPLHQSKYYLQHNSPVDLPMADYWSDCLLRLPFYYELDDSQIRYVARSILDFFGL
jgi:dTDP-4-amino-4,6-dideoxygalactose transaminase